VHPVSLDQSNIVDQGNLYQLAGTDQLVIPDPSATLGQSASLEHSSFSDQTTTSTRNLWLEALEQLPENIQTKLRMMDSDQKSAREQIDDVVQVTKKKQEECEAKFWKFPVGKHEIILRDYAIRIVSSLTTVGNIAIQFAPPQAAIAWSAVKIVMQVRQAPTSIRDLPKANSSRHTHWKIDTSD